MNLMKLAFSGFLLGSMLTSAAQAHFIWVVSSPEEKSKVAKVYLSEMAAPDDPDLLSNIAGAKTYLLGGRGGEPKPVEIKVDGDALVGEIPERNSESPVIVAFDYGVMARGPKPFLLQYYAKTYPSVLPGSWKTVSNPEILPLEICPVLSGNSLTLTVRWHNEPLAGSQVTVEGPGIEEKTQGDTNEHGQFVVQITKPGLFSIRARREGEAEGEFNGKKYTLAKQYSTLSLRVVPEEVTSVDKRLPSLEKGITSFGGAVVGDYFYTYGGHYGAAHHYSQEGQSGEFARVNLVDPKGWESLPGGPKLTGLAMVTDGNQLYRVGGFTAENNEEEDEKLVSKADFARFDPATGTWTELPSLPQGRSSHDCVVVGNQLYVVGGWSMDPAQESKQQWHKTALVFDLAQPDGEWKEVAAPPFERRALSLAARDGKIYAIGGMQSSNGPTTRVDIFDPSAGTWSDGPSILGGGMDGFGTASFNLDGQVYTTTMSGSIQKLSADGAKWEYVGQLKHPRFFHELAPWNHKLIVVGGASMDVGKIEEVEEIQTTPDEAVEHSSAAVE
ncbi:Kelch repeat-containing protein [Planctomicrobium sp. SH668]|uniref:Kelch repeat-containing protein n=1 Tax=Planctomicrobium sp. SH668 TaxID=3448126 RepID=UPI003F5C33D9